MPRGQQRKFHGVKCENGRYRARITQDGECKSLGVFDSAKDAAMAYDKAAKRIRDRKHQLNFA